MRTVELTRTLTMLLLLFLLLLHSQLLKISKYGITQLSVMPALLEVTQPSSSPNGKHDVPVLMVDDTSMPAPRVDIGCAEHLKG